MKKSSYKIPIELLELEDDNYHFLIRSHLNDDTEGIWVLDTGASKSVLNSQLTDWYIPVEASDTEVKSAGIGEENVLTSVGEVVRLKFGDLEIKNWNVAIINLEHINKLYSKFTDHKIAGLLGSDFLVKYQAVINLKKQHLKLISRQ
jgi:hypothetical protein